MRTALCLNIVKYSHVLPLRVISGWLNPLRCITDIPEHAIPSLWSSDYDDFREM